MVDLDTWGRGVRRRLPLRDIPIQVQEQLWRRDGVGCVYCRQLGLTPPDDEPLELDHIQPLAEGGDYHWSNLRWLCRSHNRSRGTSRRPRQVPPGWLLRLSRTARLEAHVLECQRLGLLWEPQGLRLRQRVRNLTHGRAK